MSKDKKGHDSGVNVLGEIIISFTELLNTLIIKAVEKLIPALIGRISAFLSRKNRIHAIEKEMLGKMKQASEDSQLGWSVNSKRAILLDEVDISRHMMVVGGSGWGKSSLLKILLVSEIKKGLPVVLIDPKGSLEDLQSFREICASLNRKCFIFSDNYVGPESRNMNPYRELEDTKIVASIMRMLDFAGTNPFFVTMAQNYLFMAVSKITNEKMVPSLPLIYKIINSEWGEDDNASGLLSQLKMICESSVGKLLADEDHNPAVNMTEAIDQSYCLYISLSTQAYGGFARSIGKIFTNEVLQISAFRNAHSVNPNHDYKPFTFIIEETGSMIEPDFLDLVNKARSSGTRIVALVQSIQDFEKVQPGFAGILTESFSTFFFSRQLWSKSTEELSKIIGTSEDTKETKQTNDDSETGGGSIRDVEKYIVHPNIFRDVNISQFVFVKFGKRKEVHLINVKNPKSMIKDYQKLEPPLIKTYKREYSRKVVMREKSILNIAARDLNIKVVHEEKPKLL